MRPPAPSVPRRACSPALLVFALACLGEDDAQVDDFAPPALQEGEVAQSPGDADSGAAPDSGDGQGSDSDGGDDNGGADGLDTSAPPPSPESCSLEATGLCYELPQGGGPEAWCDGLAAGHGDTAGWFAGLCEVGEALRCALPAGGPLEVAVDRLYYAPAFDPSSARADCLSAGGIAGE